MIGISHTHLTGVSQVGAGDTERSESDQACERGAVESRVWRDRRRQPFPPIRPSPQVLTVDHITRPVSSTCPSFPETRALMEMAGVRSSATVPTMFVQKPTGTVWGGAAMLAVDHCGGTQRLHPHQLVTTTEKPVQSRCPYCEFVGETGAAFDWHLQIHLAESRANWNQGNARLHRPRALSCARV